MQQEFLTGGSTNYLNPSSLFGVKFSVAIGYHVALGLVFAPHPFWKIMIFFLLQPHKFFE